MKALPILAAIALIAICVPMAHAGGVQDADEAKVANCTFIKEVSAPTTNGGRYTRAALGAAMEDARAEAAKAGATHIVWNKVSSMNVANVTGKAYRCPD